MKRSIFLWSILFACLSLPARADKPYVLTTAPASDPTAIAARYGLTVVRTKIADSRPVSLVTAPSPLSDQQISAIKSESSVVDFDDDDDMKVPEARPTATVSTSSPTTNALQDALSKNSSTAFYGNTVRLAYISQAATTLIANDYAHQKYATGAGIVAVIDTGVDPTHPALRGALVPGYDFTRDVAGIPSEWADLAPSPTASALTQSTVAILDQKNTPAILNQSTVAILDQSTVAILDTTALPSVFGHGTMVAGLIHLAAPSAQIMPLKAFRSDGSSDIYQIIHAIYYAADHGARVINMSFSLTTANADLARAIAYANGKGVICVASGGNDGTSVVVYPSAIPGVIGVGSTNNYDIRSTFSNYGSNIDVAAPGEALITTYPGNNYAGVWGTSFSAALVSGAVALMVDVRPSIGLSSVVNALNQGVDIEQNIGRRLQLVKNLSNFF